MNATQSMLRQLAVLLICMTCVTPVLAGATLSVGPYGDEAGETRIVLRDAFGAPMAADENDPHTFTNLPPGSYVAEVVVDGRPVASGPVALEHGTTHIRVAGATGDVEVVDRRRTRQQTVQQQAAFGFGAFLGLKLMRFDGEFRSPNLGLAGSGDIDEEGGSLSLEARYYFRRQQQTLGAALFLYGTYVEYFGTDAQRAFLNAHPTTGDDSGVKLHEKRSLLFGVGGRWNIAQRTGFELMLGGHWTRAYVEGFSDESCCGSTLVRFGRSVNLWGPAIAVGVTYQLFALASGHPVFGTLRWTGMRMRRTEVNGSSPVFPFLYGAAVASHWQHMIQVGVEY